MTKCKENLTIKTFVTLIPKLEVQVGFSDILPNEIITIGTFAGWVLDPQITQRVACREILLLVRIKCEQLFYILSIEVSRNICLHCPRAHKGIIKGPNWEI